MVKIYDILNVPIDELSCVGGKAYNLSVMKRNGFPVPSGFVLPRETCDIFTQSIDKTELDKLQESFNSNQISKEETLLCLEEFKNKIISQGSCSVLTDYLTTFYNHDHGSTYAVRSSSTVEDSSSKSWAGQFDSFLNIKKDDIAMATLRCISSMYNYRTLIYCSRVNTKLSELEMSVVVQEMVSAKYSGIIFTSNPVTKSSNEIIIEIGLGLGDKYVSGKANPETYIVSKENNLINNFDYKINKNILIELTKISKELEVLFSTYVDIEFAIDDEDNIFILQCRPITTM